MTTHYNPTIAEDAARILNTKSADTLPSTMNILTPTKEIKERINLIKTATINNATSAVMYVTPTGKDFYISAMYIQFIKDVTATATTFQILADIDGTNQAILAIKTLTTTVHADHISVSLPNPIKIDRGTQITLTSDTNNANFFVKGHIYGYSVETTKGV